MTNKLFIEVTDLDAQINKAFEAGDDELESKLYDAQCALIEEIESKGLRPEFDKYIASIE